MQAKNNFLQYSTNVVYNKNIYSRIHSSQFQRKYLEHNKEMKQN